MTLSKGPATINIANSPADRSPREGIVETIIAEATEAAHRRVTPHSVDWSSVSPARVESLFSALGARDVAPPSGLVDALLLAGHTVLTGSARSLEQRALNDLNRATAVPAILAADISRLAEHEHIAPEIAGAIVRRLASLGADAEACSLGLALWRSMPQALSPARSKLASHLAALPPLHSWPSGISSRWRPSADA